MLNRAASFDAQLSTPADRDPSRGLISTFWIAVAVIVFTRTAWIGDDAYITLRTIDNFVQGFGLRWNVAERVQAFTHPLWTLALIPAYALTREPYFTTIMLSVAVSAAAVVLIVRLSPSAAAASWAAAALVGSKAFVDYSTSGLENPLTHVLLVLFWAAWRAADPRRAGYVWLLAALRWMNRFDLLLIVLPGLVWKYRDLIDRPRLVAVSVAPAAAWAAFALCYYGTILPNTAYAKLATGVPESDLIAQGFLYLVNSLSLDPVTLAVIGVGIAVSLAAPRREWCPAAGMLLYLAYVVAIGGDFMSGRMLTPIFIVAVLQVLTTRIEPTPAWIAAAAITLAISLAGPRPPLLFDARDTLPPDDLIEPTGIADERLVYHQQGMGLLLSRRGNPIRHPFMQAGVDARRGPHVVHAFTIGMMGYYAGPDIHVVDTVGLSEPLLARLPALPGWRIGHYYRSLPAGYLETLATGRDVIQDRNVAQLYHQIALITRGPIWTVRRWKAIIGVDAASGGGLLAASAP